MQAISKLLLALSLTLTFTSSVQADLKAKPSDFIPKCTEGCGGPDWNSYEVCNKKPKQYTKIPSLKTQPTYHDYRQQLIKAGWKALRVKPKPVDSKDPDIWAGAELWKMGYKELEHCAGTGLAPCSFRFMDKKGNHLRVQTAGEESPQDKSYAIVTGTKFLCFE